MRRKPAQIAYIIEDPDFGRFPIRKTDGGWWSDVNRVLLIVEHLQKGRTLKQALEKTLITKKMWRRFVEVHPEFNTLRRNYKFERGFRKQSFFSETKPQCEALQLRVIQVQDTPPPQPRENLQTKEVAQQSTNISLKPTLHSPYKIRGNFQFPHTDPVIELPAHECQECTLKVQRTEAEARRIQEQKEYEQSFDISMLPQPPQLGDDYESNRWSVGQWFKEREQDYWVRHTISHHQFFRCKAIYRYLRIEIERLEQERRYNEYLRRRR